MGTTVSAAAGVGCVSLRSRESGDAVRLARFALFVAAEDPAEVLSRIVAAAISELNADLGGLSLFEKGRLTARTPSDEVVARVDEIQHAEDEGPCVQAARSRRPVRVVDFVDDRRWPRFGPAAAALGMRSAMSVPISAGEVSLGALNLYSRSRSAFSDEDESRAELLGVHAALALVSVRKAVNLQIALTSRDIIGQAKGILMERHRLTADQAFAALVEVSQRTHRRLRNVADELAATGELTGLGRTR
jgi:GAF domain-containing protein